MRKAARLRSFLPNRDKTRRAKLTISHPHFSGQGATVLNPSSSITRAAAAAAAGAAAASSSSSASFQPQQHGSFPSRLFRPRLSLVDGMRGLEDDLPDGISLSSISDSLTTVSSNFEEYEVKSGSCRPSRNAEFDEVDKPDVDSSAGKQASDKKCFKGLYPGVKKTTDDNGVKITCGDRVYHTLQRPQTDLEYPNVDKDVTNTGGDKLCRAVKTLNHDLEMSNDHKSLVVTGDESVYQITERLDQDLNTSAGDRTVTVTGGENGYHTTQGPHQEGLEVTSGDKDEVASDTESVYRILRSLDQELETDVDTERANHAVKGWEQDDLSVTSNAKAVTVTNGQSVFHIRPLLDQDLDADADGEKVYHALKGQDHDDLAVENDDEAETATDSESVYRILQSLDQDLETDIGSERVYHTVGGQEQEDLSVTRTDKAVTVTDGGGVYHIFPRLDQDLETDIGSENVCHTYRGPEQELPATNEDKAVTVTDGESVYHILRRLDQDLEAHMVTETQEDSVDVESVDSFSSAELSQNVNQLDLGERQHCSIDQCKAGKGRNFEQNHNPPSWENLTEQTVKHRKPDFEDKHKSEFVNKLAGPSSVRRPGLEGEASLTHSSPSVSDDGDVLEGSIHSPTCSDTSSSVSTKFNAELDSYDVNPLHSPGSGPAAVPTNLYAEEFSGTAGLSTSDPVQLYSTLDDREKSFVRRVSFSSADEDARLEDRVLEELVNTLDSLGPGQKSQGRPPSKFHTVHKTSTSSSSLGQTRSKAGKLPPKFYTAQRSRSESPYRRSDMSVGTIRSHDLWSLPLRARRSRVRAETSSDSRKMTWPGGRRGGSASVIPSSTLHVPRELGGFLTVGRADVSKDKRLGAGRASTTPRRSFREGIGSHSFSPLSTLENSSNAGGVLSLEEEEQWRREVDGNHNKRKVTAVIQREDVVFGTNSVGSETANLY